MGLAAMTMLAAAACTSQATSGRTLAPGAPDVLLPDPSTLPKPPGLDAGPADDALRLAH